MIRKKTALILAVLMIMLVFSSCKAKTEENAGEQLTVDDFKTFGDIETKLDEDQSRWELSEHDFMYLFALNDRYYKAYSEVSDENAEKILNLDLFDEKEHEEYIKTVSGIEISSVEDITDGILTEDKLSGYKGKKGQVLMDEGWAESWYDLESLKFSYDYGYFNYIVTYEGNIPESEWESFVFEDTADMVIKSVEFNSMATSNLFD